MWFPPRGETVNRANNLLSVPRGQVHKSLMIKEKYNPPPAEYLLSH
jgi:hypothetical protein